MAEFLMSESRDPIRLYYWPTPNGRKVSVMLEECGLPYRTVMVDVTTGEQFAPDFLAISPNNRIPAIVDPGGPSDEPVSVFESGAILQYLSEKTGRFGGDTRREKIAVAEWLFWQVGGLGPMAGQPNHFRLYASETIPYAVQRYTDEVNRLFGVMNTRLAEREYLAGPYSIADMASIGWVRLWRRLGQNLADFPHLKRWCDAVLARPAVVRAFALDDPARRRIDLSNDETARAVLFGQRAR
jgi:GSH-dependent disulfide-bond oxidoreductase